MGIDWPAGCCAGSSGETVGDAVSLHVVSEGVYRCETCGKFYEVGESQQCCGVAHAPGPCCHYGDIEVGGDAAGPEAELAQANAMPDGDYLDLIDRLSELAHERWSDWMQYLFARSQANPDGSVTIPADKAARWRRQSLTAFEDLPAAEQLSDAREALRMADVFFGWVQENQPTK